MNSHFILIIGILLINIILIKTNCSSSQCPSESVKMAKYHIEYRCPKIPNGYCFNQVINCAVSQGGLATKDAAVKCKEILGGDDVLESQDKLHAAICKSTRQTAISRVCCIMSKELNGHTYQYLNQTLTTCLQTTLKMPQCRVNT